MRVLYAHTDKMGVVNNARYLEYFEAGRNDLLRSIGAPYTELEKLNIGLPVIEALLKFIQPAAYDDVVTVKSSIRSIPTVRFRIDYEVLKDFKLLAAGYTIHAFIDLSSLRPIRPPSSFIELLKNEILKAD